MLEIQLHPNTLYTAQIIEDFAKERALVLSMKGSLKSKVANVHYHFKRTKERGVLEITIFEDCLQINVHDNRQGDWINLEIEEWKKRFN
ncbi:MAG: hypothetical protein JNL95_10245 [Chitinophagales bacterium]|nr:hypothetical protein [Chitinophagales bacterium]